ncbi:DeoR/GlpR family DNA-binding transcription regulator [Actinocrispum wychmicini]|uniref:DeoR family transcriptional regulator n=1 Tax=Actinocrispum wychmicini TaxID=1213861 RepID=A0A4R2JF60_9PSEU|nr:DeoR/GlpR family DNA-binding transcription regulator [Actinocrispum wychmicini]TCO57207.1 DeoR family transcriptional regulator [Actinocrispum wychmicini]
MLPQRRHAEILQSLAKDGSASVTALCHQLGTSPATIRRDLIWLEGEGVLTRVHGGAILIEGEERAFDHVSKEDTGAKDTVAATAAAMIRDGESVLLDIGTTTHKLATHLHGRAITVITSNLAVYDELARDEAVELILLGGMVRRNYRSMVGFLTEDALRQVRADRLFLGACGVRADGSIIDDTVVEVPLKRAMLAAADEVVLVADEGKFPGGGLARICGPEEIDKVVTNVGADKETLTAMKEAGVEVIQA